MDGIDEETERIRRTISSARRLDEFTGFLSDLSNLRIAEGFMEANDMPAEGIRRIAKLIEETLAEDVEFILTGKEVVGHGKD